MKKGCQNDAFLIAQNHVWRYTLRFFHTFSIFEKVRKIDAKRGAKSCHFSSKIRPWTLKGRFIRHFLTISENSEIGKGRSAVRRCRLFPDTFPPILIRRFPPRGAAVCALRTQWLLASLLASIFRIFLNRQKTSDKSTLERPKSHFGSKMSTFGLPFGIDFSTFFENRKSVK